MWNYEKRLQFPVNIKKPDARAAQVIISQYGGPDGELSASMRYLSQRFAMTNRIAMGALTDDYRAEIQGISGVLSWIMQKLSFCLFLSVLFIL